MLPIKDNIPTLRFPVITVALILINVAMFFGFQHAHWNGHGFAASDSNTVKYAFNPYKLTHLRKKCGDRALLADGERVSTTSETLCQGKRVTGETTAGPVDSTVAKVLRPNHQPTVWLTILTAMFMHGGLLHIAGNMLFLWIFGNNVEDSLGKTRFVLFYLLAGLAATYAQSYVFPGSATPLIGAGSAGVPGARFGEGAGAGVGAGVGAETGDCGSGWSGVWPTESAGAAAAADASCATPTAGWTGSTGVSRSGCGVAADSKRNDGRRTLRAAAARGAGR